MSGFSADWLALREAADRRARDAGLLAALRAHFAGRPSVEVVDLGCGTGANLRATAPYLPDRQTWRLVDHDRDLLAAARERLAAWADAAERAGEGLILRRGPQVLAVRFEAIDLAAEPERAIRHGLDLVTAAALFDLASPAWIARTAALARAARAAVYASLIYDGREIWEPPHAADNDLLRAFHAHQRRDKGFGRAAGPEAAAALADALSVGGYAVRTAPSPWRLGPDDRALIAEVAEGSAKAAVETGLLDAARIASWLAARRRASACGIGHADVLGLPPG